MKIIYTSRIKVDAFDTLKDYSVMMYRKQMAADTVRKRNLRKNLL